MPGQPPWAVVVASDQAPQLVAVNDRDGHRRVNAHVAQVLAVDRRDIAQDGVAHVQRQTRARVERWRQRRRVVIDLGDQPQPVLQVQRARLLRNIGRRVVQVEKGLQVRLAALGNHPARAVLHELVHQHAVVNGHVAHALGSQLAQRVQGRRGIEALHHVLHSGERVGRKAVVHVGGLELQHQGVAAAVQAGVQRRVGLHPQGGVQQVARCDQRLLGAQAAQKGDLHRAQHRANALAQQRLQRCAEQARQVTCGLQHLQGVAVEHQQHAVRQDGARNVNRLAVAVGDVGRGAGGEYGHGLGVGLRHGGPVFLCCRWALACAAAGAALPP